MKTLHGEDPKAPTWEQPGGLGRDAGLTPARWPHSATQTCDVVPAPQRAVS